MALNKPYVDGEFYIDDNVDSFYLREDGAWLYKGKLMRTSGLGFYGEGPFLDKDRFPLASVASPTIYDNVFSPTKTIIKCGYPPATAVEIAITGDVATYLAYGEGALCVASFAANSNTPTLTFPTAPIVVPAGATPWIVLPETADIAFGDLHIVLAGAMAQ